MPWVIFQTDFDWTDPRMPARTTAYRSGTRVLVTTPCAEAAIAKGAASPVKAEDHDHGG